MSLAPQVKHEYQYNAKNKTVPRRNSFLYRCHQVWCPAPTFCSPWMMDCSPQHMVHQILVLKQILNVCTHCGFHPSKFCSTHTFSLRTASSGPVMYISISSSSISGSSHSISSHITVIRIWKFLLPKIPPGPLSCKCFTNFKLHDNLIS